MTPSSSTATTAGSFSGLQAFHTPEALAAICEVRASAGLPWALELRSARSAARRRRMRSRRPSLRLGYRGEDQLISSALYRRDLESSRGDSESSRGNSDSSKGTAGSLLPLGSTLENQGPGLTGPGPLMLSLRHWQCQSRRSRTWLEMNLVRCRSACKKTVQLRIHVRCI